MKKLFLIILLLIPTISRADVLFGFEANSIENGQLKSRMETNISRLLTAIQKANGDVNRLNLDGVDMEQGAKRHLQAQWEILPFVCETDMYAAKCLNDHQGYQVRGIQIELKPTDDSFSGSVHRELTISLGRNGSITGVRPAMELTESTDILRNGIDEDDFTKRREILKWVEDFRNYYNERDITSLENIYSEDALIITGSVTSRVKRDDMGVRLKPTVKYTVQNKTQYIDKLRRLFDQRVNKYIDVKFDHISVVRSGSKPHIYGVTLHQVWKTSSYNDDGWLFLVWDFSDPAKPQIHVRTWQPDQVVSQDGLFNLSDIFIPSKR